MLRRPFLLAALACSSLLAGLQGCGGDKRGDVLDVYAASSLEDALHEIHAAFQQEHGVRVNMNNGGSGRLSIQIEQGGGCDVFLSAGDQEMDRLAGLGLVDEPTRIGLLSNQLVVVAPEETAAAFGDPQALAGDGVELLSIADPEAVPAGRYARAWLQGAGLWKAVESKVLPGQNVRSALAAVESGGAEVGIVYRTDAALAGSLKIAYAVPLEEGPRIRYPVARMLDRPERRAARADAYIAFLRSEQALEVFRRYGFLVVEGR